MLEAKGKYFTKINSDDLLECVRKLRVFSKSLKKLKKAEKIIEKAYSWFELLLPELNPVSSTLYNDYRSIYDGILIDYGKKSELLQKLSFSTFYEEKTKVGYDEEI